MKIALLTDGITPYVIGGMQKHSFYLAKFLTRRGIEVDLFHYSDTDQYDIKKLEVFSEQEKQLLNATVLEFPQKTRIPGHYIRANRDYSRAIFELIREKLQEYDFIYAKGFCAWELLDQKRKGLKCPPVGVNFHGFEMFQPAPSFKVGLALRMLRPPVRFNVENADYLFSYGGKVTDLIAGLGVSRERILEIPSGIEEKWLTPALPDMGLPRKFIFVGRNERRKGIEELNAALSKLQDEGEMEFHFVGPIPEEQQLSQDNVVYHGAIRDVSRMQELLRAAQVLVTPSHSEGMPNVILEGLASGCAVIATDVGAVEAMVGKENGWLIPPRDQEALEGALQSALNLSPAELQKRCESSLKKVREQFLWEQVIDTTINKIKAVIS